MTVPGNAVVVLVLVALFLACTGYAAGRLHQWRRRRLDRDAAYREGYETATRKAFSTAARLIGPRRERSAVDGSASVLPSASGGLSAPTVNSGGPSTSAATPAGSAAAAATPVQPSSPAGIPPSAGPSSPAAAPSSPAAAPSSSAAAPVQHSWRAAFPLGLGASAHAPADAAVGHPANVPFPAPEPPRLPGSVARPISRRAAARSRRFHSIFPPPSITPSAGTTPTDPADRQPADDIAARQAPATPLERTPTPTRKHNAATRPQHAASDDAAAEPSTPTPEATTPTTAAAPEEASRPGRHLVPDELVRAATYRLSPDRVARAKVPGAQPAPGVEDGDRNPPTAVPKPRRHPADDHAGGPAAP